MTRTWYWIAAIVVVILLIYFFMGSKSEARCARAGAAPRRRRKLPAAPAATAPAATSRLRPTRRAGGAGEAGELNPGSGARACLARAHVLPGEPRREPARRPGIGAGQARLCAEATDAAAGLDEHGRRRPRS